MPLKMLTDGIPRLFELKQHSHGFLPCSRTGYCIAFFLAYAFILYHFYSLTHIFHYVSQEFKGCFTFNFIITLFRFVRDADLQFGQA